MFGDVEMSKDQIISQIINGFVGDVFGAGSVNHRVIDKTTGEQSRIQWIGGCFGCHIGGKTIDVFTIRNNDNLIVKVIE